MGGPTSFRSDGQWIWERKLAGQYRPLGVLRWRVCGRAWMPCQADWTDRLLEVFQGNEDRDLSVSFRPDGSQRQQYEAWEMEHETQ